MGRQINYYMEYETFLRLAEKAVSLGCEILTYSKGEQKLISGGLEIVKSDMPIYYFYLPAAGKLKTRIMGSCERVDINCLSVVEAGYSLINEAEKHIRTNRLYVPTGFYDENGDYVYRPESIDKFYGTLMRYVKKLAPYTEITCRYRLDTEREIKKKEYVTPYCLDLIRNKGYY